MKLACNNLQIDSWVAFASPEKVIPDEDVIEARLWKDVPELALWKKASGYPWEDVPLAWGEI